MKKSLLLITACGFILTGCCTAHHVRKWEYRQATNLSEVNQLAEQGWTVVNFAMPDQYLLKREKP